MANNKFTAQQVIDAIPGTGGIITAIAKKLGCTWNTAQRYINMYPTVRQAYQDECESMMDLAEVAIYQSIKRAADPHNTNADTADARWYLARKGRSRGYGDNVDLTSGGEKIVIEVKYADRKRDASDAA